MPSFAEKTAGDLCLSCGMCCDNTLYGRVEVSAEESPQMRALGMVVTEYDDGEFSYDQPCNRLCGKRCEVYADRPWTCQSYNCEMIGKLNQGKITVQEGQSLIDEALAAKAELLALIGEQDHFELRRKVAIAISNGKGVGTGSGKGKLPSYAPQIERLERLLDRHFRDEDYWMIEGTKGHAG